MKSVTSLSSKENAQGIDNSKTITINPDLDTQSSRLFSSVQFSVVFAVCENSRIESEYTVSLSSLASLPYLGLPYLELPSSQPYECISSLQPKRTSLQVLFSQTLPPHHQHNILFHAGMLICT